MTEYHIPHSHWKENLKSNSTECRDLINPLNAELNPKCKSQLAEFAHDIRKTWIFRELSGINLWNKKHIVGKETDIAQNALKML